MLCRVCRANTLAGINEISKILIDNSCPSKMVKQIVRSWNFSAPRFRVLQSFSVYLRQLCVWTVDHDFHPGMLMAFRSPTQTVDPHSKNILSMLFPRPSTYRSSGRYVNKMRNHIQWNHPQIHSDSFMNGTTIITLPRMLGI